MLRPESSLKLAAHWEGMADGGGMSVVSLVRVVLAALLALEGRDTRRCLRVDDLEGGNGPDAAEEDEEEANERVVGFEMAVVDSDILCTGRRWWCQ